jgi:hypothetical protein
LRGEVSCKVSNVLLTKASGLCAHNHISPGPVLESIEGFYDIRFILSGETWPLRINAVPVHAMTRSASCGLLCACCGIATRIRCIANNGGHAADKN